MEKGASLRRLLPWESKAQVGLRGARYARGVKGFEGQRVELKAEEKVKVTLYLDGPLLQDAQSQTGILLWHRTMCESKHWLNPQLP